MKRKVNVIALFLGASSIFLANASQATPGFYMGASAGYSAINTPSGSAFNIGASNTETLIVETSSSSNNGGFGGGLFAGYNINRTFAAELGYTSYAQSSYSSKQSQFTANGVNTGGQTNWQYNDSNTSSINYNTYSIDLFLKGSVPIIAQIDAFAKVGISYVNQSVDYQNPTGSPTINVNNDNIATPDAGTNTYTALRPAGAIGLSYQATTHFSTAIFAQGFLGKGDFATDKSAIASAYLIGASVMYDFL